MVDVCACSVRAGRDLFHSLCYTLRSIVEGSAAQHDIGGMRVLRKAALWCRTVE